MRVESNEVIYSDGRHNAFTSMVRWRDKFYVAFRNGSNHRSNDGKILLMCSKDLRSWSEPRTVINSSFDDRDPTLFVYNERLFVTSMTIDREWQNSNNPFLGVLRSQRRLFTLITSTADGEEFTEPTQGLPDHLGIWWVEQSENVLYASVQKRLPAEGRDGICRAELWKSLNGTDWEYVSVISEENEATEVALLILPDKRMLAFVRHDAEENHFPEIMLSRLPYVDWKTIIRFDFWHNGPCLGRVDDTIVTASRAFFDDKKTPLTDDVCKQRLRGIILGTIDVNSCEWNAELVIPHHHGIRGRAEQCVHEDANFNFPDISYASIVDIDGEKFAMSYYEGYKGYPSDIRFAIVSL